MGRWFSIPWGLGLWKALRISRGILGLVILLSWGGSRGLGRTRTGLLAYFGTRRSRAMEGYERFVQEGGAQDRITGIGLKKLWFLSRSYFALTDLYCPDLMPLLFVERQSPPCKLTVSSEYFARMKPLATFGTTINSISIGNRILLITPVVHIIVSHRRRSVLGQV